MQTFNCLTSQYFDEVTVSHMSVFEMLTLEVWLLIIETYN